MVRGPMTDNDLSRHIILLEKISIDHGRGERSIDDISERNMRKDGAKGGI
jgi:hypothetical protein